jgi:hypothetical protein
LGHFKNADKIAAYFDKTEEDEFYLNPYQSALSDTPKKKRPVVARQESEDLQYLPDPPKSPKTLKSPKTPKTPKTPKSTSSLRVPSDTQINPPTDPLEPNSNKLKSSSSNNTGPLPVDASAHGILSLNRNTYSTGNFYSSFATKSASSLELRKNVIRQNIVAYINNLNVEDARTEFQKENETQKRQFEAQLGYVSQERDLWKTRAEVQSQQYLAYSRDAQANLRTCSPS